MTAKKKPSVYIAGPMRGVEYYNFPAFFDAEDVLGALGYTVHNPARWDIDRGFDPEASIDANGFDIAAALRVDLGVVLGVDHVFVLPGWQASTGARLEVAVAQAVGVRVIDYTTFLTVQSSVETSVA